jgi:hypothetical protein
MAQDRYICYTKFLVCTPKAASLAAQDKPTQGLFVASHDCFSSQLPFPSHTAYGHDDYAALMHRHALRLNHGASHHRGLHKIKI